MLKGKLIHPQLMAALSACGHGDKILIADGNYPLDSKTTDAELIYLGLTPGLPTVTDVLDAILSASNVEKAQVMTPARARPSLRSSTSSGRCFRARSWKSWAGMNSMTPAASPASRSPSPPARSAPLPISC